MFELMFKPTMVEHRPPGIGIFWGVVAQCTRINQNGVMVGSQTSVVGARGQMAGTGLSSELAMYYGGGSIGKTLYNGCVKLDSDGTLLGVTTNVGTARRGLAGAGLSSTLAIFYGGSPSKGQTNVVTRINHQGTLVGSQTSASIQRYQLAGAVMTEVLGMFWGGNQNMPNVNRVARITHLGTLLAPDTTVGTGSGGITSAAIHKDLAMYYGGYDVNGNYGNYSRLAFINSNGMLARADLFLGVGDVYQGAGLSPIRAIFTRDPSLVKAIDHTGAVVFAEKTLTPGFKGIGAGLR